MDGSGGLIVEDKVWVVGWSYCGGQGMDGRVVLLWRTRYGW